MKSFLIILILLLFVKQVQANGNALLCWDAPETNTDGSALTDLAGYKIYYGTTSGTYTINRDIGKVVGWLVTDLPEITYYFAVTAYDIYNSESAYSNEVSKLITSTPITNRCPHKIRFSE